MSEQPTESGKKMEFVEEGNDPLNDPQNDPQNENLPNDPLLNPLNSPPPSIEFTEIDPLYPSVSGTINNPDEERTPIRKAEIKDQNLDSGIKDDDMVDIDIGEEHQQTTQYPIVKSTGLGEESGIREAVVESTMYTQVDDGGIGIPTATSPLMSRDYRKGGENICSTLTKSSCFGCGMCCCCYWVCLLCCLCVLLIVLLGVGISLLVTYIQCVSNKTTLEKIYKLEGTTKLVFDHYGSFTAKSSNATGEPFYLVIRSYGKKGQLPNYDLVTDTENELTTIIQKHLHDGTLNEAYGIVCEGFDVELIIPSTTENVILETTSRLYGNMTIDDIHSFRELTIEVSEGDVTLENIRISGDFGFISKNNKDVGVKTLDAKGKSAMEFDHAEHVDLQNIYVGDNFLINQRYGGLKLDQVTVKGDVVEVYKKYGGEFIANRFDGNIAKLTMDFEHSDITMDGFHFHSIDFKRLKYCDSTFKNGLMSSTFNLMGDEIKYGDIRFDTITSAWGMINLEKKYGDVSLKNLQATDFHVNTKYGDIKIDLRSNFYSDEKVSFEFDTNDGDITIKNQFASGIVQYTQKEVHKKTGYINPSGIARGAKIYVNSKYGDIDVKFSS